MDDPKKKIIFEFIREEKMGIRLFGMVTLLNLFVFWLYRLRMEPFIYGFILSVVILLVVLKVRYHSWRDGREKRQQLLQEISSGNNFISPGDMWKALGDRESILEADYREMISALQNQANRRSQELLESREDMTDYYTKWAHQIKTPISVMKLSLREKDTPENRLLLSQLFLVEQYVEMVLQYIRLDSDTNDLLIQEYPLNDLMRECIRKFAPVFISRKIRLDYRPMEGTVVTDRKYFLCLTEQILSNAAKYTKSKVEIYMDEDGRVCIEDDGPGISREDVPRIFEKGYTGYNGRRDMTASGLGLYLAREAAERISVDIHVDSVLKEGSIFRLGFQDRIEMFD